MSAWQSINLLAFYFSALTMIFAIIHIDMKVSPLILRGGGFYSRIVVLYSKRDYWIFLFLWFSIFSPIWAMKWWSDDLCDLLRTVLATYVKISSTAVVSPYGQSGNSLFMFIIRPTMIGGTSRFIIGAIDLQLTKLVLQMVPIEYNNDQLILYSRSYDQLWRLAYAIRWKRPAATNPTNL